MREILFRGFHECKDGQTIITVNGNQKRGEWVYGAYFEMVHTDNRHSHHFIIPIGCDLSKGRKIEDIQVEVIPETVGQYTGLTDKNDKKIFKGDVVYNGVFKSRVEFTNGYFYPFSQSDICTFYNDECEIIGNIFDNPELLESEDK